MHSALYLLLFNLVVLTQVHGLRNLEVVYKWDSINFNYPNIKSREESIFRGDFIPGNTIAMDVDVWVNGRERMTFITFPKFLNGIPASLATVSDITDGASPLLSPYPDWDWHTHGCDGLTSVFRTQIDKCGRLWVIDSGMVDLSLNTSRRLCQPKLVAFALLSNSIACSYTFADHLLKDESILVNLAVDVRGNPPNCQDTFVYVADVTSYALLVYDFRHKRAWKVKSNTMYPYPPYGVFRANNAEFDLMDGILGLALTPPNRRDRTLYYHSLASVRESWVPTSVLRDESNFISGENKVPRQFQTSPEARKSQSVAEAFDSNGILYFGMMDDNSLNCWDSHTVYSSNNLHRLEEDNINLQFASGMKVILNENGEEEIWIMTNRFQLVMTDAMKDYEVNFRVLKGKLNDLLRYSKCQNNPNMTFPNETSTERIYSRPYNSVTGYGK